MMLGKLPVPGRPTNLDHSRARAYCACSGCGWGLFGHFSLAYHFSFLSPSLWETARYRLKYCLKGPLSPKQPTNQLHGKWLVTWPPLMMSLVVTNFVLLYPSKPSVGGYTILTLFFLSSARPSVRNTPNLQLRSMKLDEYVDLRK